MLYVLWDSSPNLLDLVVLFQGWVSQYYRRSTISRVGIKYFWTYRLQVEYYFKDEYLTTSGPMGCRRNTISRVSISLLLDLHAAGGVLFQGWVSHHFWAYGLQEEYYFKGEYFTTSGPMGCRRNTISRVSISLLLNLRAAGGVLFQGWVSLADLKGASHRAHNFLNSMHDCKA